MPVRVAQPQDLAAIQALFQNSPHVYWAAGPEDLALLVHAGTAAVALSPGGGLQGFVAFQVEDRPVTLPPQAPTRVYLRLAARGPLAQDVPMAELVQTALQGVPEAPPGCQALAITGHGWLLGGLGRAGFQLHDHIVFFERTRREVPMVPQTARLRPLHPDEWEALAWLDAASFAPLWHMGPQELQALSLSCRFRVAEVPDRPGPVGYTALSVHPGEGSSAERLAQLVRVAVHPEARGRGIGRQLVVEALAYAGKQRAHRVRLNTQRSNRASQCLYRSLDFRRRGRPIPVLTADLPLSAL